MAVSSRFVITSLVVVFLTSVFSDAPVPAQSKRIVTTTGTTGGTAVTVKTYDEIPEATEPSSPEVADWWKQIRKAGNDLQKNGGEKSRSKFFQLLSEGRQKGYRVPVKDRQPQVLESGNVVYPNLARLAREHKIFGTVVFSVEYKGDGSVGEVQIIKGLGRALDESVMKAQSQQVFLPAVQNGVFVTAAREGEVRFSDRRN